MHPISLRSFLDRFIIEWLCVCSFQQCGIFIFFFQSPLITLCVYTFTESACNAGRTGDVGLVSGSEDPLEEKMATHSSILPWRIPWTESGGLQSMGLQRVGRDWVTEHERERHFYWIYCNSQVFEHKDYGVWWSYLGILSSYMCSLLLIFFMQGGIFTQIFPFFFSWFQKWGLQSSIFEFFLFHNFEFP